MVPSDNGIVVHGLAVMPALVVFYPLPIWMAITDAIIALGPLRKATPLRYLCRTRVVLPVVDPRKLLQFSGFRRTEGTAGPCQARVSAVTVRCQDDRRLLFSYRPGQHRFKEHDDDDHPD
ncbi:hypothetical protein [Nocardia sp. N2S4-5]|uniref:hypothetical protein n=1 Tax=Nocardia sp. N2S4-5 TaxID=3351565 RepID=UPI0037D0F3F1